MKRRRTGLAALAFTVCAAAVALVFAAAPWAGSTAKEHATAQLKAAWIYVGPHNDGGWSQAHDKGRQYVQKQLGDKVKTTFKENVPEASSSAW
jgi:basic membrane lipoprotein Med (substrate-binding protein (PBP1-ABC) superfamily)